MAVLSRGGRMPVRLWVTIWFRGRWCVVNVIQRGQRGLHPIFQTNPPPRKQVVVILLASLTSHFNGHSKPSLNFTLNIMWPQGAARSSRQRMEVWGHRYLPALPPSAPRGCAGYAAVTERGDYFWETVSGSWSHGSCEGDFTRMHQRFCYVFVTTATSESESLCRLEFSLKFTQGFRTKESGQERQLGTPRRSLV